MHTPSIVVVGGGYTGAAAAIHLSRLASRPLEVTVVEPRADVGRGVAYETADPAHRLNVPPELMVVYPSDLGHFPRYVADYLAKNVDPGAAAPSGSLFVRRHVFGDYMATEFAKHVDSNPSQSLLRHERSVAEAVSRSTEGFAVALRSGVRVSTQAMLVCTSHGKPSRLPGVDSTLDDDPRIVNDPWDADALRNIGEQDRVLIVGAGLTAADVVMSLHLRGYRGVITMLSRRGLPPHRQHDFGDISQLLMRVSRPVPIFIERHGDPVTLRSVLNNVRRDIDAARRQDPTSDWREEFDHVRDAAGAIWRSLSTGEKRRYVRHLASHYSAHRNRVAPQLIDQLADLEGRGRLSRQAGRVLKIDPEGRALGVTYRARRGETTHRITCEAIINCTGPVHRPEAVHNPLLTSAIDAGLMRADNYGLGVDVNDSARAMGSTGETTPGIFVAGPLTRGYFGDVNAVAQITAQLHAALPHLLKSVGAG